METPDIMDVQVVDEAAWREMVAKLAEVKELHPVDPQYYPDGIGEVLTQFIAFFAINAQQRIANGEKLVTFARDLMHQSEERVVQLGNHIVLTTCRVLEKHWVHGDALKQWREEGMR